MMTMRGYLHRIIDIIIINITIAREEDAGPTKGHIHH